MTVLFYISGHGFGHASREVEVMNALAARHGCRLLVRSAVDPELLKRTLRADFVLTRGEYDTGIVQSSSVEHDDHATVDAAAGFYRNFSARVGAEVDALLRRDVSPDGALTENLEAVKRTASTVSKHRDDHVSLHSFLDGLRPERS